ncbi:16S rRNA (cytidine1402-2'-O)-methyltransferase [Thermonema lapsum]|uniref:Ribosomal RNA small subunit methyltransferase I n=1 Tax=Thermonema lapsum TaxID=28195 RepID=A0A846MND3_9BACT|nr:16S rRNA (cytidine(1402)-2'-O)-methyltransferase [Thermonema lapsum]NIK73063.1 16S rRNA (cytidine1402-2'-O)-methyltransferase [Thermonema lapsum]
MAEQQPALAALTVVPTPIGNLQDMTFRAVEVLKSVDAILAEDTRNTKKLLQHFDIQKPVQSYHAHNEHAQISRLIARMQQGERLALVSDAGTPAISDPGFLLVRACVQAGLSVECLPGATAFVPALVQSGLPCERFVFEGFLPHKKGRQTRLQELANESRTIVLYESPHRLLKTLQQLKEHFGGERPIAVVREISKLFAETVRGSIDSVLAHYAQGGTIKGEFVLVIGGVEKPKAKTNTTSRYDDN